MSNVSKGQIQLPSEFRPGEPIRAVEMDKLRKAIAFVMKDMIGSGRGITVTQSAGKYLISARKQRSHTNLDHPWRPKHSTAGNIRITIGNVNGTIIPENWNAEIAIEATTEAGMMWLEIDINEDGRATAARYLDGADVPSIIAPSGYDQLPPHLYYLLFAYISVDGQVLNFYPVAKKNLEAVLTVSGSVYSATYRNVYIKEV